MNQALIIVACVTFSGVTGACASDGASQPSSGSAGSNSAGASASAGSAGTLLPALGTPGVWEEVTSPNMDPSSLAEGFRHRLDRHGSGSADRSLSRRLRLDLEVD